MRRVCLLGALLLLSIGCTPDGKGNLSNNPLCESETDEQLCIAFDQRCTNNFEAIDRCGVTRILECTRCGIGELCDPDIGQCLTCTQINYCEQSGAQCGELLATTGSLLERCAITSVGCGACQPGSACDDVNLCGPCTRESDELLCGKEGLQCGTHALEGQCGIVADANCGTCDDGQCQADGICSICQPETNAQFCIRAQTANCGEVRELDNCFEERVVDCGTCDAPDTVCDDFSCICPTPVCLPDECGPKSNACGQQSDCGSCSGTDQCVNGTCECVPESMAELCAVHAECGTKIVQDRCMEDVELACGECQNDESCIDNECTCVPEPDAQLKATACMGKTCGMVSAIDSCGDAKMFECGACAITQRCHMDECCSPITPTAFCTDNMYACGTYAYNDGCGAQAQAQCGTCSNDDVCTANACQAIARTVIQPHFGRSVSLDGGDFSVGAAFDAEDPTKQGHLYVFRAAQLWNSPKSRTGSSTYGWSVAMLGDRLAVGAPGVNSVEMLHDTGAALVPTGTLPPASAPTPNANLGFDLSASQIHPNEEYLMISSPTADLARPGLTYTNIGGYMVVRQNAMTDVWEFIAAVDPWGTADFRVNEAYAYSVLEVSGPRRAYSSPTVGSVIIQSNAAPGSQWRLKDTLTKPSAPGFGAQISMSPNGRMLAITARPMAILENDFLASFQEPSAGTVYIYEDTVGDGSGWVERAALSDPNLNAHFGYSIAQGDEDLFVGMPGVASVRHYKRDPQGTWTLHGTKTKGGNFGYAIDFDGRFLAVTQHDTTQGTVYLYEIQ